MLIRLLLLIILLSPLCVTGQHRKNLDSLVQKIAGSSPDELRTLFFHINGELRLLPFEDRNKRAKEIFQVTKQQNSPLAEVYAYNELSGTYAETNTVEALKYSQEALTFARTKDSVTLSVALLKLGGLLNSKGMHPEAVKVFLEISEVARRINDTRLMIESSQEIVTIYYRAGNYEDALAKGNEFTPLFKKPEAINIASRSIINTLNTLALTCHALARYDSAINYFDQALQLAHMTNDEEWIGLLNGNKALAYQKLGRHAEALKGIQTDLAISKKYKSWGSARNCCISLCDIYLGQKSIRLAQLYLDSVVYFTARSHEEEKPSYWRVLSAVEAAKGNFKAAHKAQEEYAARSLDAIKKQQTEQVARIKSAYDLSQSQKEIELLTDDNLIKQSQLTFQRTLFIAGTIVLILLSILTIHFIYSFKRQKKNAQLITLQRDEITAKSHELEFQNNEIAAQNEELIQQQEEIAAQRDALESQNIQLQAVQEVIEKQREDIQSENERLEIEVNNRTQELRRSNRELIEHNNQLEQFAFITAHNLRSPVARILGLGNLLEFSTDPADAKSISKNIVTSTRELDAIVLDLAKILEVKGNSSLVLEDVDLASVLERTYKGLEKEISETGAQIKGDFSEVGKIFSVAPYVESIIYNLVSNAIKYRHPNRRPVIELRSSSDDKYFCLAVSDNGLGMDLEKYKDNLFKLYKRFHFHVEGKGLGLYLVKTQITALGGRIEVKSEPGNGTTFLVYFKK